ncbi:thiolase, putative [Bodo saltans]|uniref:Thiolase, putative n=1 Tax=Bodo saltans TaxID=75058 RepID=A0A0S4JRY0_BODSA|nr:thiolase, putative [Bodo saltans]|eukprot:CUG93338.1 thiolase, putative [Bodo saltans]
MSIPKVVICSAVRTPIGAIGGALADMLPRPLAILAAKAAIAQAKLDPKYIDYTTMGWVAQDPRSPNIAKTTCEFAGAPLTSGGTTVHENCASGGAAIHDIARRIICGEIQLGIAGGVESMSNVPRYLFNGRMKGQQYGDMTLVDGLMGALTDTTVGKKGELMGLLTERLVEKYKVSREVQDEVAFESHKNAITAWENGSFDYVTKVEIPGKKGVTIFSKDEGPKKLDLAYFTKQKPYFKPEGGTITGANSSSLNDAAAAIIIASESRAKELGLPILAELKSFGNIGVPKELMGEGAFKVVPRLLERSSLKISDIDFYEMNEAFAAVVGAAYVDIPELKKEKMNQWGSGISLGHPVGCTGVRQVVDMVHQLGQRGKSVGMTTRCVGGGMGSGEIIVRI